MARFARRYGAYELNQCKLKVRAYDTRPCETSLSGLSSNYLEVFYIKCTKKKIGPNGFIKS
jgi:hypothetical protein